uniref:Uncharacterized protein n=1 Tax=uncultured marine virus TaxID=186617 RepID=A0A0F7L5G0_9VIRU|nr:hypothetical protein [uncultured marine virus]
MACPVVSGSKAGASCQWSPGRSGLSSVHCATSSAPTAMPCWTSVVSTRARLMPRTLR